MGAEGSVRGEGSVTFIFSVVLQTLLWRLFELAPLSVLPSFHCHHDSTTAVPCASAVCHKGAPGTGIEWSWVSQRKTDEEQQPGILLRSQDLVIHKILLHSMKAFQMSNIQTEEKPKLVNNYASSKRMKDTFKHDINGLKSTVRASPSNWMKRKPTALCQNSFFPNSSNVNSRIVQRFDTKSEAATLPSNSVHLRL